MRLGGGAGAGGPGRARAPPPCGPPGARDDATPRARPARAGSPARGRSQTAAGVGRRSGAAGGCGGGTKPPRAKPLPCPGDFLHPPSSSALRTPGGRPERAQRWPPHAGPVGPRGALPRGGARRGAIDASPPPPAGGPGGRAGAAGAAIRAGGRPAALSTAETGKEKRRRRKKKDVPRREWGTSWGEGKHSVFNTRPGGRHFPHRIRNSRNAWRFPPPTI